MAEVIQGAKLTTTQPGFRDVSSAGGNQQALFTFIPSQPLFLHRIGMYAGKAGANNPRVQFAVWDRGADGFPGDLVAYTDDLVVGGTGLGELSIVWSRDSAVVPGIAAPAAALLPGQQYFLGVQVENAAVRIYIPVGAGSAPIYSRTVGSGLPTNPFGAPSGAVAPVPGIYAVCNTNSGGTVTLTGPAATVTSTTPAIAGTFSDPESGPPNHDRVLKYILRVRQAAPSLAVLWEQEFATTAAERSAAAFSRAYAGPELASGGSYEVQAQSEDRGGTRGAWSGWRAFAVAQLGLIDVAAATPNGKEEDGAVGPFVARWTHPTGLAANGAMIQIISGGIVVRQTPAMATITSVANNGFITLTEAQAAVATAANPLPSGAYHWQMRGRSTDGAVSPWSDPVPFAVNYPPNQPSGLRPVSGQTFGERPLVDWLLSDPDLDDVLGVGLMSVVEVTRPDGSVWTGETANVDPTTGRGYLQMSATQMPVNGAYAIRVRGRDLSAAGLATEYGPWSAPVQITFAAAPIVTITAPTQNQVVATGSPNLQWTVADGLMARYRVQLYRTGATTPFFSSGEIPVAIPAPAGGYTVPANWLKNGLTYDAEVTIWTTTGISGTSQKRTFAVTYPSANLVQNVAAALRLYPRDAEPNSVTLSWSATGYPQSQFGGYVVTRRATTDPPGAARVIAHVRNPAQTGWTDHHAPPNVGIIYGVYQLRRSGAMLQAGDPTEVEIVVPLATPMLVSTEDPETTRGALMWLSTGFAKGFRRKEAVHDTWGNQGKPTYVRPPRGHGARTWRISYTLLGDARGALADHIADVERMAESGDVFSLRTERETRYVRIPAKDGYWRRGARAGVAEVTLDLEEVAWNDQVEITG